MWYDDPRTTMKQEQIQDNAESYKTMAVFSMLKKIQGKIKSTKISQVLDTTNVIVCMSCSDSELVGFERGAKI